VTAKFKQSSFVPTVKILYPGAKPTTFELTATTPGLHFVSRYIRLRVGGFGEGRLSEAGGAPEAAARKEVAVARISTSWDRCCDFLNIVAEKFGEKMAFLTENKAK
jgi:hypothetical protein